MATDVTPANILFVIKFSRTPIPTSWHVAVAGPFLMPTNYQAPLYTTDMIHIAVGVKHVGVKHGFLPKDGSRSHILCAGLWGGWTCASNVYCYIRVK